MRLAVGDLVVYGSHGAGRVTSRQNLRSGESREVVVLDFAAGLSVTLPLQRALEFLRPVASESEVARIRTTLREDIAPSEDRWLKRSKATQAKVTSGEAVGLAEVVRDGARGEGRSTALGEAMRLSPSEHQLYLKARRLLADEIGLARGVESSEADDWITSQLLHTARQRSSSEAKSGGAAKPTLSRPSRSAA
jgi:RNA polymerase-interacting CarD/CdnL/TRCF family regulator